jgi:hypothetical protein
MAARDSTSFGYDFGCSVPPIFQNQNALAVHLSFIVGWRPYIFLSVYFGSWYRLPLALLALRLCLTHALAKIAETPKPRIIRYAVGLIPIDFTKSFSQEMISLA